MPAGNNPSPEDLRKLTTAAEQSSRSMRDVRREISSASDEAVAAFERMAASGTDAEKKIAKMMLRVAKEMEAAPAAGARAMAAELEGAVDTMDAQLGARAYAILRQNLQHFAKHSVDVARIYGKMSSYENIAGPQHVETQIGRVGRLQDIAKQHGIEGPAAGDFATKALERGSEGNLNYFQQMKDAVAGMASRSEINSEQSAKATAYWNKRQHDEVVRTTRSTEENMVAEAREGAAKKPLEAAMKGTGLGSDLLRSFLGSKAGLGMLAGEGARTATVASGGSLGLKAGMGAMGAEAMVGMAGLVNSLGAALAPMAILGAAVGVVADGFERTKKTGVAAFIAAGAGARQYASVLSGISDLGQRINSTTMSQRLIASRAGVNIDELNLKSIGALTAMGTFGGPGGAAARLNAIPGMVPAMNEVQALGLGAGMGAEEAMGLAAKGQRAFNLKGGDEMIQWFRSLKVAADVSGQSMKEFVGSMGDFSSRAAVFGDRGTDMVSAMSTVSRVALGRGLSQGQASMMQGAVGGLADAPLSKMLALNVAGFGGSTRDAAGRLSKMMEGGSGTTMLGQVDAFREFIKKSPGITPNEKDPLSRFKFAEAVDMFMPGTGKATFASKGYREALMSGDLSKESVQKTINEAMTNATEGGRMIDIMGAQKGTMDQLLGVVKETAVMIAQSGIFSKTDAGRHIAGAMASDADKKALLNIGVKTAGRKGN